MTFSLFVVCFSSNQLRVPIDTDATFISYDI